MVFFVHCAYHCLCKSAGGAAEDFHVHAAAHTDVPGEYRKLDYGLSMICYVALGSSAHQSYLLQSLAHFPYSQSHPCIPSKPFTQCIIGTLLLLFIPQACGTEVSRGSHGHACLFHEALYRDESVSASAHVYPALPQPIPCRCITSILHAMYKFLPSLFPLLLPAGAPSGLGTKRFDIVLFLASLRS